MAEVRPCLFLLVMIVSQRLVTGSPSGSSVLCNLFCDDDDSSSDDDYGLLDVLLDPCFACPSGSSDSDSSPSDSADEAGSTPTKPPAPLNLMIPPANGLNVSLENIGGSWWLNLFPWAGGSSAEATTPAATTAAPAATTAANETETTAAPAA
ncbi:uncharacterized protein LOC113518998 [Galleria mellonella]|uniref:Uncharacterized protein LOC113518998 n=1 Tax=Galleria mellonella TaxID=7137 RepID=A0A6J3BRG3_GALME|nr:uncharacterized protein LOC113518998 [Galleria mellonella]